MLERYLVSVFSTKINTGNPCFVYVSTKALSPSKMQAIAVDVGLSETAFLYPFRDGYKLRIFSPACEMLSCIHATIAACYVIKSKAKTSNIYLGGSLLQVAIKAQKVLLKVTPIDTQDLTHAVALNMRNMFNDAVSLWLASTSSGRVRLMIELASEENVSKAVPQSFIRISEQFQGIESFFLYATASGSSNYVGRMFAPSIGINEDPVNDNSCIALHSIKFAQDRSIKALTVRQSLGCKVNTIISKSGMFISADCMLLN